MRNRWVRRAAILAVIAAAVVVLRATLLRPEPVPVTVFRVAKGRVEETVTNSKAGTVRSRRRATLSTEIGGRVEALPVREGDRVAKGQILLRLADADYRAQLDLQRQSVEAAQATAEEACRSAELAERELERNSKLADAGLVALGVLDRYRVRRDATVAACEAARARVGQARAAVAVAEVNREKTVLRAPFDGIVADVSTELGEWITPSPPGLPIPPVIEIIDPESIYVRAPLDEVDVGKVHVGLPVRVTLDAYPGRSFLGRVSSVAPFVRDVADQSRTFDVEVELEDEAFARGLLPGTSADVEIILEARENVLRIPTYALIEGDRVLVVRNGVLESVPVVTGLSNWEFTEIAEGLSRGEPVVVSLDRTEVEAGAPAVIQSEIET